MNPAYVAIWVQTSRAMEDMSLAAEVVGAFRFPAPFPLILPPFQSAEPRMN